MVMSKSKSLELSTDVLQGIADAFPVPVMIISEDGEVLRVIGEQGTEYAQQIHALQGKALHEIWEPEKAEGFLALIRAVIDDQAIQSVEYWLSLDDINRCYETKISTMDKYWLSLGTCYDFGRFFEGNCSHGGC